MNRSHAGRPHIHSPAAKGLQFTQQGPSVARDKRRGPPDLNPQVGPADGPSRLVFSRWRHPRRVFSLSMASVDSCSLVRLAVRVTTARVTRDGGRSSPQHPLLSPFGFRPPPQGGCWQTQAPLPQRHWVTTRRIVRLERAHTATVSRRAPSRRDTTVGRWRAQAMWPTQAPT